MLAILLSYLPSNIALNLVLWLSLFGFLIFLSGEPAGIFLSVFPIPGCLLVIVLKLRNASIASKLGAEASRAQQKFSDERLVVMDIDWLARYLLRLRAAGIAAAMTGSIMASFLIGRSFLSSNFKSDDLGSFVLLMLLVGDQLFLWVPSITLLLLTRHFLCNQTLGNIATFFLTILIPIEWLWLIVEGTGVSIRQGNLVDLPSKVLEHLTNLGPVAYPYFLSIIATPILLGQLLYDATQFHNRVERFGAILGGFITRVAYHGRVSLLGAGLRDKNQIYRLYYSWRRNACAVAWLSLMWLALVSYGVFSVLLLSTFSLIGGMVSLAFFWLADHIWEIMRRLWLRPAEDILKLDPRKPVLILRSFTDDKLGIGGRVLLRKSTKILEVVTKWCSLLGPVITFGRPAEWVAALGPPRLYVNSEKWRDVVTEYIAEARLVIIFVGQTASLDWEVKTVLELGCLDKVVFVVPPIKMSALGSRWGKIKATISERMFFKFPSQDMLLKGIDPSAALLFWYREGTLNCLTSRLRNRLVYEIAFKVFAEHLAQAEPDLSVEHDVSLSPKPKAWSTLRYGQPSRAPSSSVPAP